MESASLKSYQFPSLIIKASLRVRAECLSFARGVSQIWLNVPRVRLWLSRKHPQAREGGQPERYVTDAARAVNSSIMAKVTLSNTGTNLLRRGTVSVTLAPAECFLSFSFFLFFCFFGGLLEL